MILAYSERERGWLAGERVRVARMNLTVGDSGVNQVITWGIQQVIIEKSSFHFFLNFL